jgi:hypothetical protein
LIKRLEKKIQRSEMIQNYEGKFVTQNVLLYDAAATKSPALLFPSIKFTVALARSWNFAV